MPYRIRFRADSCVACGTCMVACMDQWDIDVSRQIPLRSVFTKEENRGGKISIYYISVGCMHCRSASCMDVCPKGCLQRDTQTGFVILDRTECVGCGACQRACPLDAIGMDADQKASKCNGCRELLELGLRPACERACQEKAIRFEWVPSLKSAGAAAGDLKTLIRRYHAKGGTQRERDVLHD